MYKKFITLLITLTLIMQVTGISYALRPVATAKGASRLNPPNDTAVKIIYELPNPKDANILSLGAGNFSDEKYFAEQGCRVTAIEKKKLEPQGLEAYLSITPFWGDIQEILPELASSQAGKFDVVYARLSLHYFSKNELEAIFGHVARLLRPGGCFYFVVKSKDDYYYVTAEHEEDAETWLLLHKDKDTGKENKRQFFDVARVRHYVNYIGLQLTASRPLSAQLRKTFTPNMFDKHISQLLEISAVKPSSAGKNEHKKVVAGDVFDMAAISLLEGDLIFERKISPSEEVYSFENNSYIVWTMGPKAGRIYRIIPRPSDDDFTRLYQIEEIYSEIGNRLEVINRVNSWYELRDGLGELWVFMQKAYHGDRDKMGLKYAQIFSMNDEYHNFIIDVQKEGITKYLIDFAKRKGYHNIDFSFIYSQGNDPTNLYYYGHKTLPMGTQDVYFDKDGPVILVHKTYSAAITNIINLSELTSYTYFLSWGLPKTSGEARSHVANTPRELSFYYYPSGEAVISGGFGEHIAFELPIAFGISKDKSIKLDLKPGMMGGEAVIRKGPIDFPEDVTRPGGHAPLAMVTHIFVPHFAVEEIRSIFYEHGFNHIKVLPLGISNINEDIRTERFYEKGHSNKEQAIQSSA